jgi:hypothetical protein
MINLDGPEADLAKHDLAEATMALRYQLHEVRKRSTDKPRVRLGNAYVALALEDAAVALEKKLAGINPAKETPA